MEGGPSARAHADAQRVSARLSQLRNPVRCRCISTIGRTVSRAAAFRYSRSCAPPPPPPPPMPRRAHQSSSNCSVVVAIAIKLPEVATLQRSPTTFIRSPLSCENIAAEKFVSRGFVRSLRATDSRILGQLLDPYIAGRSRHGEASPTTWDIVLIYPQSDREPGCPLSLPHRPL